MNIGNHATTIRHDSGRTVCTYHRTDIVSVSGDDVILNSGGWFTATTKRRMNQCASEWNLHFRVYQTNHKWWVSTPFNGELPFKDGMRFPVK